MCVCGRIIKLSGRSLSIQVLPRMGVLLTTTITLCFRFRVLTGEVSSLKLAKTFEILYPRHRAPKCACTYCHANNVGRTTRHNQHKQCTILIVCCTTLHSCAHEQCTTLYSMSTWQGMGSHKRKCIRIDTVIHD